MAVSGKEAGLVIISGQDEMGLRLQVRLASLGYRVLGPAPSPARGLALARAERTDSTWPGLILMDQVFHRGGGLVDGLDDPEALPLALFIPPGATAAPGPCPFIRIEIPADDRGLEIAVEAARLAAAAAAGRRSVREEEGRKKPIDFDALTGAAASMPGAAETKPGEPDFRDALDFVELQAVLADFHKVCRIGMGIIDLDGRVLAAAGWQDVCRNFHRVHPETAANCLESDRALTAGLQPGELRVYKCKNGMWDVVTPVFVDGRHVANLFLGQFFFEEEAPDYAFFRRQAEKYGFDPERYLAALDQVPRWNRETLEAAVNFFSRINRMLSNLGHGNMKLSQAVREKEKLLGALRVREELFRSIAEQVTEAIYITDVEGDIQFMSPAAEEVFGFKPGEMIGRNFVEYLEPRDMEKALAAFSAVLAEGGQVSNLLLRMKDKNGNFFSGELNGSRYVKNGAVVGTLGVIRDVTERKNIERDLDLSGRRLRQAREMARLGYWEWERSSNRLTWTDEVFAIFGRDPETFATSWKSFLECVHPDDRPILGEGLKLLAPRNKELNFEHRIVWPDGTVRFVEEAAAVEMDETGTVLRIMGCIQDITRRKKAEQVVIESEIKYRTLIDNAADAIFIADVEKGTILEANRQATALTGRPASELVGMNQRFLHPAGEEKKYAADFKTHTQIGDAICVEAEVLHRDGAIIPVEISTSNFEFSGRKYAIGLFRDISARKRSAELLLESRRHAGFLADLLERGAQPFAVVREDGGLILFNAAYARLTGYAKDELADLNWSRDLTPPEWRFVEQEKISDLKLTGNPTRFEMEYIRKNGARIPVEIFANLVPTGDYTAGVFFAFISDISERKKAVAALLESERKFRILADQSLLSICIIQLDGFKYVNRAYLDLTGYSLPELMAMSAVDTARFVHPDYRDFVMEQGRLKMTAGLGDVKAQYVYKGVRKNGEERWVEQYSRTVNWQGAPADMMTLVDVTEREEAKRQLTRERQTLKTILDGIPDVVSVQGPDHTVISYNQAGYDLLGKLPGEVIGEKCFRLIGRDSPCEECSTAQAALSGRIESREFFSDHFHRFFHTRAIPIFDESGAASMVLEILQDVTERKKEDEEKLQLKSQLHQARKMEAIGALAGGVAHDFNNLLQAINGCAQILLFGKRKTEPGYWELTEIYKAGERAAKLVRQLLAFSRKIDSDRKPISLNYEVEHAARMLERTIPKMVEIVTSLDRNLKAVNADPVQIEQILLNLGVNAADAMPEGGRLTIKTENRILDDEFCRRHMDLEPGRYAMLSVSDTGAGMDPDTIEHIFEPFFTTKAFGKGTGLGLSSVYGIVKNHGGNIICRSRVKQGSTFELYFPAIQLLPQPSREEPAEENIAGGVETILIVDDEESIRDFSAKALRKFGFTVLKASSGEEAVGVYSGSRGRIDLVVLDIGMPGMGGTRCLQEILALDPGAKVVIASGYSVEGPVQAALDAGAVGFIPKPYPMADLVRVIRRIVDAAAPGK
ncbi:MAG: PAS domain S-box protein [Pseudomonadota bacterium]